MARNQIRIIGGLYKSRIIKFNKSNYLRPTTNIVRQRLFNWLGQDLTNKMILDLFAGSGVLGFESSSRNAKEVFLVENSFNTYQNLKKSQLELGLKNVFIKFDNALNFLRKTKNYFDIIFLDPPYKWDQWDKLLLLIKDHITSETIIYIESNGYIEHKYLKVLKSGSSGVSKYLLVKYKLA